MLKTDEKEEREILIEKKVAIKLLIGFAFALKHYLRDEEGNILADVERIATEVQNPFGYGYNHFDLDYFC
ncbi:18182_t:CDS:2, partial [Gigaspora margarita]